MRTIFPLIILFLLTNLTALQAQKRQKVFLKNGSQIVGKVAEEGDKITIATSDGSLWKFEKEEVVEIKKFSELQRKKGFFSATSFSLMTGVYTDPWSGPSVVASPSIYTFNGYQSLTGWTVGIGLGIDGYPQMPFIPITYGMRKDIVGGLYAGVDVGYAFPWAKELDVGCGEEYEGGFLFNPKVGLKRYGSKGDGYFLEAGWKLQNIESTNQGCWWGGERTQDIQYRRFVFSFGLFF